MRSIIPSNLGWLEDTLSSQEKSPELIIRPFSKQDDIKIRLDSSPPAQEDQVITRKIYINLCQTPNTQKNKISSGIDDEPQTVG